MTDQRQAVDAERAFEWDVALPTPGTRLPDFTLAETSGALVRLGGFRQRRPVVLVVAHAPDCASCRAWLVTLARERAALSEQDAAVLIVVPAAPLEARTLQTQLDLAAWMVLPDPTRAVIHRYAPEGGAGVAVYAADRYGVCLARWAATEAEALPAPPLVTVAIRDAEAEDCGCGLPAWPEDWQA